jgi:hypothetical protein
MKGLSFDENGGPFCNNGIDILCYQYVIGWLK